MIFLPQSEKTMWFHDLPAHVDNHPRTTKALKDKFKDIRRALNALRSEDTPHKAVAKAAEQKLHNLEDQQFKDISAMGAVRLP
jgi:DnaJ-domain-containing protein 1